jgi:neutral ceramidase
VRIAVLWWLAIASVCPCNAATFGAEPFLAGVAVVDVTPPVPFRMSGYFNERLSTGTKDPLHAKAIVLKQGEERAALVFCDMVGVPRAISAEARKRASEASNIPVENIAIAATHSHTGPLYFGSLHDYFRKRSIMRQGRDPYDTANYRAELVGKIVRAVVEAKSALRPVELKAGNAREERVSFNRRFHMRDGSVRFNPGERNPDILRPAGPIDPQVGIITLSDSADEQPIAAIVSFALHLDTLSGTEFSADFPVYIEKALRDSFGPGFHLLFGIGTCGDINHIDVSTRERRSTEAIGAMLGETVLNAIESEAALADVQPKLAMRAKSIEVPLQHYSPEEVEKARKNMGLLDTRELSFLRQVEAAKIMDLMRWPGNTVALEVQAIRLGDDTAIVMLPGEVFAELGLAIKAASPFRTTLVVELTNDALGYIPTKKAFVEGSYETVNSRTEPGSGEQLVEAAIGLLKELK